MHVLCSFVASERRPRRGLLGLILGDTVIQVGPLWIRLVAGLNRSNFCGRISMSPPFRAGNYLLLRCNLIDGTFRIRILPVINWVNEWYPLSLLRDNRKEISFVSDRDSILDLNEILRIRFKRKISFEFGNVQNCFYRFKIAVIWNIIKERHVLKTNYTKRSLVSKYCIFIYNTEMEADRRLSIYS